MSPVAQDDAPGWLYGADAIAAFLGLPVRSVRHLVARHGLPAGRLGRQLCTRKGLLLEWMRLHEGTLTSVDDGAE